MKKVLLFTIGTTTYIVGAYLFKPRYNVTVDDKMMPYSKYPKKEYENHPNKHIISKCPQKIGIIGAGVSGLATAKELMIQGYDVEVLEKNSGVGGVWLHNYENAKLQGPKEHYGFPDFPMQTQSKSFPTKEEVLVHLDSYAKNFKLYDKIKFNSNVNKINQLEDKTWRITLDKGEVKNYDFLVIATGAHLLPYVPKIKGQEKFKGKAYHSSQMQNIKEKVSDKKVVIVGSGKSAIDIATQCAGVSSNILNIWRTAQFHLTPSSIYGIPCISLFTSRFFQSFHPSYDNDKSYIEKNHYAYKFFFKLLEKNDKLLPEEAQCTQDFQKNYNHKFMYMYWEPKYNEYVKQNKIQILRGQIDSMDESGIYVEDKHYDTDVIVYATGFKRNYLITKDSSSLWLYREIIHPDYQNLAFIGIKGTTYSPLYYNLSAIWLTDMLRGSFKLPSIDEMKKDIELRRERFYKAWGKDPNVNITYQHVFALVDTLLNDMNIKTNRKSNNFKELFAEIDPSEYKTICTHRV